MAIMWAHTGAIECIVLKVEHSKQTVYVCASTYSELAVIFAFIACRIHVLPCIDSRVVGSSFLLLYYLWCYPEAC